MPAETRTTECFRLEIDDRIAHLVLNRPEKRNAMNAAFWRELPALVREVDARGDVRALVVSSTGPHFSGGLDVSAFGQGGPLDAGDAEAEEARRAARLTHGARFYDNVRLLQDSFTELEQARIPVIAAIQGGCIGGGVDLVTACDIRYCSADAFFTIYETKIGMTADVGTFPRIVKLLPEGIVRELAYTGRRMPAEEALQWGLVNRVYPDPESLVAGALELAREIASNAPLAVYGCKRMINYARDHSTADALDYIAVWNASMLHVEEIGEAMAANAEKRPGRFAPLPPRRGPFQAS